jgi:hypothetical protein
VSLLNNDSFSDVLIDNPENILTASDIDIPGDDVAGKDNKPFASF